MLGQPEGLDADRVDVAREALDQEPPGAFVARAAARDELCVGDVAAQCCCADRSRFAIVSSSFHAIEAFDSTSGRNSHEVSPKQRSSLSAVIVALRAPSSISAISPK